MDRDPSRILVVCELGTLDIEVLPEEQRDLFNQIAMHFCTICPGWIGAYLSRDHTHDKWAGVHKDKVARIGDVGSLGSLSEQC